MVIARVTLRAAAQQQAGEDQVESYFSSLHPPAASSPAFQRSARQTTRPAPQPTACASQRQPAPTERPFGPPNPMPVLELGGRWYEFEGFL